MKLKYYLRGLGIGIAVTAFIMSSVKETEKLTDAQIKMRALELGMVEETVLADLPQAAREEEEKKVVFSTPDFFVDEQEDYKIEWVIPNAQKNEMEPILLTIYPHKRSKEMSVHHGEEFGYVLKGSVTLVCGNRKYKVKSQETFYLDGSKGHYLYNHGNCEAKVLWVTTPPMF